MYFNFPVIKGKFQQHAELKANLLEAINKQKVNSFEHIEEYASHHISRLDWDKCITSNRPWVKMFGGYLIEYLNQEMLKLSLVKPEVSEIWFQQYFNNDTHGWHAHANNFTGVYYLELNNSSPRTQLVEPMTLKMREINAEEGDIVVFPSVYIHRAPKIETNERKTIISFNFECSQVDIDTLNKLKELYEI